jgi:hypothetical protein
MKVSAPRSQAALKRRVGKGVSANVPDNFFRLPDNLGHSHIYAQACVEEETTARPRQKS